MAAAAALMLIIVIQASAQSTEPDSVLGTPQQPRVIAVLRDFQQEKPGDKGPAISQWNWTAEQKQQATSYSNYQIVDEQGRHCMKLTVTDQLPWANRPSYRVFTAGPDLLPPTADAVRLHYRVLEGQFIVAFGSPTVYFGTSDVFSRPVTLTADPQWQTMDVSLHDELTRNYRRAHFTRQTPVIYYTRWIQEPMYFTIYPGTSGTILIDRIELLNVGRGRPYPTFDASAVQVVQPINIFDSPDDMRQVYTASHQPEGFNGSPHLARGEWGFPKLSYLPGPVDDHRGLLHIEQRGEEEVAFTGIRLKGTSQANAIAMDIRASHASDLKDLSLDMALYVCDEPGGFPWDHFARKKEPTDSSHFVFDYYMSEPATREVSCAFYHARRAVPNGAWTRVIVPLADFICVYGSGRMTDAMMRQLPIRSEQAVAIQMLPSYRQHRQETIIDIDRIEWVHVPENVPLVSFPQARHVSAEK